MSDEVSLTERQREVVGWLAHGLTMQQIAEKLGISHSSVKQYTIVLRYKLGVNRTRDIPTAFRELTGDDPYEIPTTEGKDG